MDHIQQSSYECKYRGSNILPVKEQRPKSARGSNGFQQRSTEVEQSCCLLADDIQGDPGAAVPMRPARVEEQEYSGQEKAEHRDKHHPALQRSIQDPRGGNEDPDKAPKDHFRDEENIWKSCEDGQAAG